MIVVLTQFNRVAVAIRLSVTHSSRLHHSPAFPMRINLIFLIFILLGGLAGCSHQGDIKRHALKRHYVNSWEQDIGYAAVTQAHGQLFISGVACEGPDMQKAVASCYEEISALLQKFSLTTKDIIKENVYTTNIDALIKAIPERKKFFQDGNYPAATWVEVKRLYDPSHILEVEVIASLP
jgi:2-iminobutanoate/2-iminopropanoate deaminase